MYSGDLGQIHTKRGKREASNGSSYDIPSYELKQILIRIWSSDKSLIRTGFNHLVIQIPI